MKAIDTAIVILIFTITAVLAIAFVKNYAGKGNVPIIAANPSPTARFVRYMACALAACTGGCDSSMTYSLPLEYGEADELTLGCNQLLHNLSYCTGSNPGQKRCGSSYALKFTFEKMVEYRGDYYISYDSLEGACSIMDEGAQTDASCYKYFREYMDCACLQCPYFTLGSPMPNLITGRREGPHFVSVYPEGRLITKTGGCGQSSDGDFGSIYVSDQIRNAAGNPIDCETNPYINYRFDKCTFDAGTKIKIWAENAGVTYNWCFLLGPFKGCLIGPNAISCQKVVLCEDS